jgi:hypothetical protein
MEICVLYFYAFLELGHAVAQRGLGDAAEQEQSCYGCEAPFRIVAMPHSCGHEDVVTIGGEKCTSRGPPGTRLGDAITFDKR